MNEQERLNYKREFDRDHQEYKSLQAELDTINQDLADLDKELDRLTEGSPQFLVSVGLWSEENEIDRCEIFVFLLFDLFTFSRYENMGLKWTW